jgi:MFS family permease
MIIADVIRLASQGITATLFITGHIQIWELMLLQAVNGAATATFNPAITGFLPSIVTSDQLQKANAMRELAASAGYIAGPAVAGILVTATGPGWAFAVDAGTFAVSACQLARVHPRGEAPAPGTSLLRDFRDGWTELRTRTWLWSYTGFCSAGNMFYTAFLVLGPVVIARSRNGAAWWAVLVAALGAGALLGSIAALHIRPQRPLRAAALAVMLFPLPTLALAAQLPTAGVAVLCVLAGAGTTVSNTLSETAIQRHVRADALSRISAFSLLGSLATQPLGQAAVGSLGAGVGVFPVLWIAGSAHMLSALSALSVPAIRRLTAWPQADHGPPAERQSEPTPLRPLDIC